MSSRLSGTYRPLRSTEFLALVNTEFNLYGNRRAKKLFEKYKHMYYNEDRNSRLIRTADYFYK